MPGVVSVELTIPLPRERAEHTTVCVWGGKGVDETSDIRILRIKNICNVTRIGRRGKHQKAWKQEIRREHNSNPLQRQIIHMYTFVVFHAIWWFSKANPSNLSHIGGSSIPTYRIIDCSFCAS